MENDQQRQARALERVRQCYEAEIVRLQRIAADLSARLMLAEGDLVAVGERIGELEASLADARGSTEDPEASAD